MAQEEVKQEEEFIHCLAGMSKKEKAELWEKIVAKLKKDKEAREHQKVEG